MPVRFPHSSKMKCIAQMSSAATNARSATASRALVADGNGKTQSRLLPSAARRRSLHSGSVPAVSPPALHFAARRTADRSSRLFFTMKPGDGNFQTFGNGRNFVIHQIAFLPLNARNGSLVENDAFDSQAASQIVLRNRRLAFRARFPNPPANDVPSRQLMSFFQNM